jgi:hypothetical protein
MRSCQTNANQSQFPGNLDLLGCAETAPLGQSGGAKCFWKINANNWDYSMGSDDPMDLSRTNRVLTIMLAEEY